MTAVHPSEPSFAYDPVTLARERRPRMLTSLLLSSTLIPLAFLLVGSLVRLLPQARVVEVRLPPPSHQLDPSGQSSPKPVAPVTPQVRIRPPQAAFAVPVIRSDDVPSDPTAVGVVGDEIGPVTRDDGVVLGSSRPETDDHPINEPGQAPLADQLPTPTRSVKPIYPELARDMHVQGVVLVFLLVGRDGRVHDVRLDAQRHVPVLDPAALAAARQWRFEPALAGGHAVAAWVSVPFRFVLNGGD